MRGMSSRNGHFAGRHERLLIGDQINEIVLEDASLCLPNSESSLPQENPKFNFHVPGGVVGHRVIRFV